VNRYAVVKEVALREIRERGRSKAYLVTSVLTLAIVLGLILVPILFAGGTDEYEIGSIGEGNIAVVETAILVGNAGDHPDDKPSVSMTIVDYPDRPAGEQGLTDGDIDALLVDGIEVVTETISGIGESSIVSLLQRGAAAVELEIIVSESGDAAQEVIDAMTADPLTSTTLSGDDADNSAQGFLAYVGLLALYIAILLYGTWILTGVTEEKTNRVVEVLLASLKPWQLLAGKIVGIGSLGLAQFGLTLVIALGAVSFTDAIDLPEIPAGIVFNLIFWFVVGFLLYGVLFAAAGSTVSRMEDAQTAAMPMTLIAVVGMFLSVAALQDPDGLVALIGTFIPLTAPFVVPVRAALGAIPAWQYALSVAITLGTIVVLVNLAGRIYAGSLLHFGSRVKLKDAWRSASN